MGELACEENECLEGSSVMTDFKNLFSLDGQVALVTGAGGILGRQFASGLVQYGARVAMTDVSSERLAQSVAEVKKTAPQATVETFVCDLTEEADVKKLLDQIEARLGKVTLLLNNAASKGKDIRKFFDDADHFDLAVWKEVMSVNLDAVFLVAREVGARLRAAKTPGSIIQIGSIYGVVGPDASIYEGSDYLGGKISTPPVYAASKAGVLGLTKYLATTWAKDGIRVNAIVPGGVQSGQNDEFLKRYAARTPMGRMAQDHEIVGAAIFLGSAASSYVTGQVLCVDGGWTAW